MPALSSSSREELLRIARAALESFVRKGTTPPFHPSDPALWEPRGCFVTLKRRKGGGLRGCLGVFETERPLFEEAVRLTEAAASRDFRFSPVAREELEELVIEISILSPLEPIHSAREIEVGRHGIWVRWKQRSGAFLPEVAEEMGWTAEELVKACLREKAFVPEEAWLEVTPYRFTTEKIQEGV